MAAPYRACAGSARRLRSCGGFATLLFDAAATPPLQGVSRAVLLASAMTVSNCAHQKQRTCGRSCLRGEGAYPERFTTLQKNLLLGGGARLFHVVTGAGSRFESFIPGINADSSE